MDYILKIYKDVLLHDEILYRSHAPTYRPSWLSVRCLLRLSCFFLLCLLVRFHFRIVGFGFLLSFLPPLLDLELVF